MMWHRTLLEDQFRPEFAGYKGDIHMERLLNCANEIGQIGNNITHRKEINFVIKHSAMQ